MTDAISREAGITQKVWPSDLFTIMHTVGRRAGGVDLSSWVGTGSNQLDLRVPTHDDCPLVYWLELVQLGYTRLQRNKKVT